MNICVYAYINNSRHLVRKYTWTFVRGHNPFQEANSFPKAKLEENCELRGTNNVQGRISEHILDPNRGYCVYHPSNLFRNVRSFENWGIFSIFPSFSWGMWQGNIPWYTTNHERALHNYFIPCIENTVASTINDTYPAHTMGRFGVTLGTLRYTTAGCCYGYFGREGIGWQLCFLRKLQTE